MSIFACQTWQCQKCEGILNSLTTSTVAAIIAAFIHVEYVEDILHIMI